MDLLKSYNERGLASVLDGAGNHVERAAQLLRRVAEFGTPPIVQKAHRKEVELCLAEAEELIAKVREKLS